MSYKWKPSKTAAREFSAKMDEIRIFCAEKGICQSRSGDSYYFSVNGKKYRVSNHTVEKSNAGAYDWKGDRIREEYHGNDEELICITARKTRIIEIYNDLVAGYELDSRGNRK